MTLINNFRVAILFALFSALFGHEMNSSIAQNSSSDENTTTKILDSNEMNSSIAQNSSNAKKTMSKILDSLLNISAYDKLMRPNYEDGPEIVEVSMYFTDIDVSDIEMEFTAQIYFDQKWVDSRLAFDPEDGIELLQFENAEMMNKLWIPNTYFSNAINVKLHNSVVQIWSSGKVYESIRLTLTTDCPMHLQYYPMDNQTCTIGIESYSFIRYKWDYIVLSSKIEMNEFSIVGEPRNISIYGGYGLKVEIQLKRALGYYLIQIYIPAALIVVISWIAFWLNRKATGARVGVGVTTVLTITTLMSTTNSTLPKMSYIKAIDVYLGTCFVNVFSAFVESAIVGYVAKKLEMRAEHSATHITDKEQAKEDALSVQNTKINSIQLNSQESNIASEQQLFASKNSGKLFDANPSNFDKLSRVLFPVSFVIFNIIYWIVYLNLESEPYDTYTKNKS